MYIVFGYITSRHVLFISNTYVTICHRATALLCLVYFACQCAGTSLSESHFLFSYLMQNVISCRSVKAKWENLQGTMSLYLFFLTLSGFSAVLVVKVLSVRYFVDWLFNLWKKQKTFDHETRLLWRHLVLNAEDLYLQSRDLNKMENNSL